MAIPQAGIFAIGEPAHIFLELAVAPGVDAAAVAKAVADVHEPRTTVGGINFVAGFRPELWRAIAPDDTPAALTGFNAPLQGTGSYSMPATQTDVWLWFAGASYDVVFDAATDALHDLTGVLTIEREQSGWSYRHSRDLTGFEDGTENPSLMQAPLVACVPDGSPGAGGSVLLFQKWRHDGHLFVDLPVPEQEKVIGRTKLDSVELPEATMPKDAHVPRTTVDVDGKELDIFRRNVPYGTVVDHGTVFIGFSQDQLRLDKMLRQMAGSDDGIRDALTRYTTPLTGAYYFVPSLDGLRRFATPEDDD
ncbi:MAG TPA: Dyp-type peroxidase [Candidatus Sulfotelmatobacter sp.]|nr:Dyp-type peroxidase [Candidatus Sulfotelmatobacter sp.]